MPGLSAIYPLYAFCVVEQLAAAHKEVVQVAGCGAGVRWGRE
jgi:hypothetical protein